MSTALMPLRRSTSRRISSVHGSAPKMPISRLVLRGSTPWASISSRIARKYDGVTMITRGSKSTISCTCRVGHAAGDRDDRAAEPLGAVVRAEPAGEQPVAVGHVHDVPGPAAGGADRARHHLGPGVEVVVRVARRRSACPSYRWRRGRG